MATSPKTTTRKTTKATAAGRKTRRSTSASTVKPKSTAKPAAAAKKPVAAAAPKPVAAETTVFRRPDLIQAVADRTALKRSDAKIVLELVLDELGKALDKTDEVQLPPLGKFSVKRRRDAGKGTMLTVKLRRPDVSDEDAAPQVGLADAKAGG